MDEWTRAVIDAEGTVAARSRSPQKYVGSLATLSFREQITAKDADLIKTKTLEDVSAYVAYSRSSRAAWTSVIAVPIAILDTPIRNSTLLVTSLGCLLLLLCGALSWRYAHHLARSICSAAQGADALARGESPRVAPSRVAEVEHLRLALQSAAALLEFREKERNENLAQAEAARVEAENANSAKSNFLANMSHEIRTPLGAIMGFAELMRDPLMSSEDRESFLATIQRNGELLTRVIGDILDLSKIESGASCIELVRCSLPVLLADIEGLLAQEARKKNISLHIEPMGKLPEMIETDPTKLKQILINILGNAIKFTKRGRVALTVSAQRQRQGAKLSFVIEDTGCGIAPEHRAKLFKPFSQADESTTRTYGGSGLGLLLSRKLSEVLGGGVELIESFPGQGSKFRVQIFATWIAGEFSTGSSEELTVSTSSGLSSLNPEQTLRGMGILVVEDVRDNQLLIRQILRRAGAGVDLANNGLEGLEKAMQKDYDIVLMDLQMPIKSGFEATSELRAQGYRRPILALTAAALNEERERALQSGFDDLVTKPINRNILIDKVREYAGLLHPSLSEA